MNVSSALTFTIMHNLRNCCNKKGFLLINPESALEIYSDNI